VTAAQSFQYDPKVGELYARLSMPLGRLQLSGLFGGAYLTSRSTNTIVTRVGSNVVNTQSQTTENKSWSPLLGAGATIWVKRWVGAEGGYRWMRMKDGTVNEPMHKITGGLVLNLGPY
jgi:hypothetical protein